MRDAAAGWRAIPGRRCRQCGERFGAPGTGGDHGDGVCLRLRSAPAHPDAAERRRDPRRRGEGAAHAGLTARVRRARQPSFVDDDGLCGGRLSFWPWCGKRHVPGGACRTVEVRRSPPSKVPGRRRSRQGGSWIEGRGCSSLGGTDGGDRRGCVSAEQVRGGRRVVADGGSGCDLAARAGDLGRCEVRHSGLVRYFGRVFENQGTVERDREADPARSCLLAAVFVREPSAGITTRTIEARV